jgi:DNA-binding response OmpR family regulator
MEIVPRSRQKILVIDDEVAIREFITAIFKDSFEVLTAATGLEGVRLAKSSRPDLILLDILMPGDDGIACLQELRSLPETVHVPVLMLTALNEPDVRIRAFKAGADDFISKPFQPDELLARIESKLNRFQTLGKVRALALRLGNVHMDLSSLRVTVAEEELSIAPVEFKILSLLMRQKGLLTKRDELEKFVWSNDPHGDRGLDSHISSLRKKLRHSSLLLQTVYGSGYTLSVKAHDAH